MSPYVAPVKASIHRLATDRSDVELFSAERWQSSTSRIRSVVDTLKVSWEPLFSVLRLRFEAALNLLRNLRSPIPWLLQCLGSDLRMLLEQFWR